MNNRITIESQTNSKSNVFFLWKRRNGGTRHSRLLQACLVTLWLLFLLPAVYSQTISTNGINPWGATSSTFEFNSWLGQNYHINTRISSTKGNYTWFDGSSTQLMSLSNAGNLSLVGNIQTSGASIALYPAGWGQGKTASLHLGDGNHSIGSTWGVGTTIRDVNDIIFHNDADGAGRPNHFIWEKGGHVNHAELMRLNTNGHLGIGTKSPQYPLDVNGIVNASQYLINGQPLSGNSQWTTASGNKIYYTGNVGIGTNDPKAQLEVYQAGAPTTFSIGGPGDTGGFTTLNVGTSADKNGYTYLQGIKSSGSLWGDIILNKDGGRIGIGTTSPQAVLDVVGSEVMLRPAVWSNSANFFTLNLGDGNHKIISQWGVGTTLHDINGVSLKTGATPVTRLEVNNQGNVLIYGRNGKNSPAISAANLNTYSLIVEESILTENYVLAPVASWADYVFNKNYKLKSLEELEAYISKNKHLPNIPTDEELKKDGYALHDMNIKMMEKIEELTLYAIEQQKKSKSENGSQQDEIISLQQEIKLLKEQLMQYRSLANEIKALKKLLRNGGSK